MSNNSRNASEVIVQEHFLRRVMSSTLCKFFWVMFPVLVKVVGDSVEEPLGAAFIGEEVHGAGASPQFPKTSFQYIGGPNRLPLFFGQIIIP